MTHSLPVLLSGEEPTSKIYPLVYSLIVLSAFLSHERQLLSFSLLLYPYYLKQYMTLLTTLIIPHFPTASNHVTLLHVQYLTCFSLCSLTPSLSGEPLSWGSSALISFKFFLMWLGIEFLLRDEGFP